MFSSGPLFVVEEESAMLFTAHGTRYPRADP